MKTMVKGSAVLDQNDIECVGWMIEASKQLQDIPDIIASVGLCKEDFMQLVEVTKTLAAGATVSERFATGSAWHDSWESGGDHDSSEDYRLESILYGGTRYTINYRSPVTISLGGGQVVCNGA